MLKLNPILRIVFLFFALVVWSGCGNRVERIERREERDPLIQKALRKKRTMDMDGARDAFMQALDRHPELARAHLELGRLYDDYYEDYVRAIYHYERYVELRPDAEKKTMVEDFIRSARLSFATTFPHQPSGALAEIRSLKNENKMLRRKMDEMLNVAGSQASTGSSLPDTGTSISSPAPTVAAVPTARPAPARPAADTYVVQPGDTLSRIARRVYNDSGRWKEIYDFNRGALSSPQSLRVGQTLMIPR